jgi:hypothetical protein
MSDPVRISPTISRRSFPEGAIGVHPTGSGGAANVIWLSTTQTHCHVVVWTDDDVLTTADALEAAGLRE